jgi:hypothetical protein
VPHFSRYIGIDYSGAETADSSCKGLRVYVAEGAGTPKQILLPKTRLRSEDWHPLIAYRRGLFGHAIQHVG